MLDVCVTAVFMLPSLMYLLKVRSQEASVSFVKPSAIPVALDSEGQRTQLCSSRSHIHLQELL